MKTKVCYTCKVEKEVIEFYKSNVHYYQKECKQCCKERKNKWHKTEQGKRSSKNTKLKRFFGITLDEYELKLKSQNHTCPICKKHSSEKEKQFAVDHNHTTGEIRDLLCRECNLALGNIQENYETALALGEYIKKWSKFKC